MSKGTARRTIRIGDLWDEAQAKASERGDNLSDVIRQALKHYTNPGGTMQNNVIRTIEELREVPNEWLIITWSSQGHTLYYWDADEERYYDVGSQKRRTIQEMELPAQAIEVSDAIDAAEIPGNEPHVEQDMMAALVEAENTLAEVQWYIKDQPRRKRKARDEFLQELSDRLDKIKIRIWGTK